MLARLQASPLALAAATLLLGAVLGFTLGRATAPVAQASGSARQVTPGGTLLAGALPCGHLKMTDVSVTENLREASCKQGHQWLWTNGTWHPAAPTSTAR